MASNDNRTPREHRIPRAEVTGSPLDGPDRVGAFLQEIKAGAAPLTGIIAVPAEVPTSPGGVAVATVPFLTTPLMPWNKITTGDPLHRVVQLLQDRGGLWLAKRTMAVVEWTVGPTHEPPEATPQASGARVSEPQPASWVRVDFTFSGAWNGRFALAGPAAALSADLWCIAASPLVGVLPEEVAGKALPAPSAHPVAWAEFTRSLDNALHTTTNPSDAVRRLVVASGWPGADRLTD